MELVFDRQRRLLDLLLPAAFGKLLDDDDIGLVDGRHEIGRSGSDIFLGQLQHVPVASRAVLHDHDDPAGIRRDPELFGPSVDIHQQEVVQQEVLHEAVLVVTLLEGRDQSVQLEGGHPAHQESIVRISADHQHIFQLLVLQDFEELVRSRRLRIGRRSDKIRDRMDCVLKNRCSGCDLPSLCIHHADLQMSDVPDSLDRIL